MKFSTKMITSVSFIAFLSLSQVVLAKGHHHHKSHEEQGKQAGAALDHAENKVGEKVADVKEAIAEKVHDVADTVKEKSEKVRDNAKDEQVERAKEKK